MFVRLHVRHVAVIAALVVAGAACGSSSSKANSGSPSTKSASNNTNAYAATTTSGATATTAATGAGAGATPVKVATVGEDKLVVNGKGFTVYAFSPDTATTSACTTTCDKVWPPVTVSGTAPATVSGLKITTLTRSDGTKQVVVNGHPVYTFSGDTKVGNKNGQGIAGKWYYVNSKGEPDKG